MQNDPRDIINREPMSRFQVLAVAICVFLNALDGFDVLAVTFAAPGIARGWDLGPGTIGIIISTGLVGMAFGSILLAPFADRYGRRTVILACIIVMGGGMLLSATANDIVTLSIYRFITGLGIGTMLASINAMAAEFSNDKRRNFCISIITSGYPIGGVLGGSVAVILLQNYDWQSVFIFGGLITLAILPVVIFALPESIEFLSHNKGSAALDKINGILRRMGHSEASHVSMPDTPHTRSRMKDLFSPDIRRHTITLTFSYFLHIMTFYYIMGWVPSIVTALGFDKAIGTSVSVWVSIGGVVGGSLLGWTAATFSLRKLTIILMIATGSFVILFGQVTPDIQMLKAVAFLLGFCMFGGVVGLYAITANTFPTRLRATGTGFVIGVGRAGAAIGPVIAGFLLASDMERGGVAMIMAVGSFSAAIALIIGYRNKKSHKQPETAKL